MLNFPLYKIPRKQYLIDIDSLALFAFAKKVQRQPSEIQRNKNIDNGRKTRIE